MGLLNLPQELINAILVEIGDSYMTYRSLARVCRTFNALANPLIYDSVIIRQASTGEKFAETMTNAPHLTPLVHKLQLHLHGTEDDVPFNVPEEYNSVLAKLVNLESLVIKSDWFDTEEDSNLFCRPGILPALRSCQLGFDFDNYDDATWILHPYEAVFFHPSLQSLTITGACVQAVWCRLAGAPEPPPRSTQLEELRLLNCDLSPMELSEMLSYPRALKHFTFKGQSADPIVSGYLRESDRSAYIDALKLHASSLESMDLDLYFPWPEPIDLTEFKALKKLTISRRMLVGDENESQSPGKYLPSTFDSEGLTFRPDYGQATVIMPENQSCPCSCWTYRHRLDGPYGVGPTFP